MTTVPFTAQETLLYVHGERPAGIDLGATKLTPMHVWNYLSFLKTTDEVVNVTESQLVAYIKTRDYVRNAGVIDLMKQVLFYHVHGTLREGMPCSWDYGRVCQFAAIHEFLLNDVMAVLNSLPTFLAARSGRYTPTHEQTVVAPATVGVNFCNLFSDQTFLLELIPNVFSNDIAVCPYFFDLFDGYLYGGDNLIWFVTSNPDNLLFSAMI